MRTSARDVWSSPPMRLDQIAFCVGFAAAIFGLSIDYRPHNPWSYVAFAVIVAAVAAGFMSIIWIWVWIFAGGYRKS